MTNTELNWTILPQPGLSEQDLVQAQALAAEVLRVDGVGLKIAWEFAAAGSAPLAGSFCCRVGGQLAGYALLEGSGKELEVTAAVAPTFRRQGIFKALLAAATEEARRCGASSLLGVGYRNSLSGTAAMQALGLPYISSEYAMEADAGSLPLLDAGPVTLEAVTVADAAALAGMLTATFEGKQYPVDALAARLEEPNARYFFAVAEGTRIGQIGTAETSDSIYIYIRGVGILPEYRRRGYGRHLLAALLVRLRAEGHTRFVLDVATENPSALFIYKACGFRETTIYDYYDLSLAAGA